MKHLKQLVNVLILFAVLFGLGVIFNFAFAKEVKSFDLEKPVYEQIFLCLDKDIAVEMAKTAVKGDMETLQMLSMAAQMNGICGVVQDTITYKKQVYAGHTEDNLFTVYEAVIEGVTVYVPLKNYAHRGDI